MCYESEVKEQHKGSNSDPSSAEFTTAATEGQNSVDSDGNQWREVAGGEKTIWRPEEAEQDMRG